jgi:hypothetical protein
MKPLKTYRIAVLATAVLCMGVTSAIASGVDLNVNVSAGKPGPTVTNVIVAGGRESAGDAGYAKHHKHKHKGHGRKNGHYKHKKH